MTTSITKEQLVAFAPCDIDERLARFNGRQSLNVSEAFDAGFSVSDICWIAGKLNQKAKLVQFANDCVHRAFWSAVNANATNAARAAVNATNAARAAVNYAAANAANVAYAANVAADAAADAAYAANAAAYAARAGNAVNYATEISHQKKMLIDLFS